MACLLHGCFRVPKLRTVMLKSQGRVIVSVRMAMRHVDPTETTLGDLPGYRFVAGRECDTGFDTTSGSFRRVTQKKSTREKYSLSVRVSTIKSSAWTELFQKPMCVVPSEIIVCVALIW
jgi:hypothetical protein